LRRPSSSLVAHVEQPDAVVAEDQGVAEQDPADGQVDQGVVPAARASSSPARLAMVPLVRRSPVTGLS